MQRPKNPFLSAMKPMKGRSLAASKPTKPSKQEEPPKPRKQGFEQLLQHAMADRCIVNIICAHGEASRQFAPYVLYRSSTGKVLVGGYQLTNPNKPGYVVDWRNPEVGGLVGLSITDTAFVVDRGIDTSDPRYAHGIIDRVRG